MVAFYFQVYIFLKLAKFSENDPYVQDLGSFPCTNKGDKYDIKDVKSIESFCIQALDYRLDLYSSYHYLEFFLYFGIIFKDENQTNLHSVYELCIDIINNFIADYKSITFSPLNVAVACILVSREHYQLRLGKNIKDLFMFFNVDTSKSTVCYDAIDKLYKEMAEQQGLISKSIKDKKCVTSRNIKMINVNTSPGKACETTDKKIKELPKIDQSYKEVNKTGINYAPSKNIPLRNSSTSLSMRQIILNENNKETKPVQNKNQAEHKLSKFGLKVKNSNFCGSSKNVHKSVNFNDSTSSIESNSKTNIFLSADYENGLSMEFNIKKNKESLSNSNLPSLKTSSNSLSGFSRSKNGVSTSGRGNSSTKIKITDFTNNFEK